jgi:hypothetical protein
MADIDPRNELTYEDTHSLAIECYKLTDRLALPRYLFMEVLRQAGTDSNVVMSLPVNTLRGIVGIVDEAQETLKKCCHVIDELSKKLPDYWKARKTTEELDQNLSRGADPAPGSALKHQAGRKMSPLDKKIDTQN